MPETFLQKQPLKKQKRTEQKKITLSAVLLVVNIARMCLLNIFCANIHKLDYPNKKKNKKQT